MKFMWDISICKHLSINIGFLLVIIFSLIMRIYNYMFIILFVGLIHEISHLMTSRKFGIPIKKLRIMPFGIELQLETSYISDPIHEIMIAFAGPFSNVIMLISAYILNKYNILNKDFTNYFIIVNFIMAVLNLIPIVPLDGGRILKSILILTIGTAQAYKSVFIISKIFLGIFLATGIFMIYWTKFNISLLLASVFLALNLFKEKEDSDFIRMRQIILSKEKMFNKGFMKSTIITALYNTPAQKIIKLIRYSQFYVIIVVDEDMNIIGELTETQVIDGMVRLGANVELWEIVKVLSI